MVQFSDHKEAARALKSKFQELKQYALAAKEIGLTTYVYIEADPEAADEDDTYQLEVTVSLHSEGFEEE